MAAVHFAFALALPILAAPPRHRRHAKHGGRPAVSAQQARVASVKKAQLRQKLHGLHSHMHHVRAKIHEAKVQENQIHETIETVEARIGRTRRNLGRVNLRLASLANQRVAVSSQLDATKNRLRVRRQLLSQRVRDNYQRGQTTYTQVLLQSRSVHELLSRGYYVRQIVHSDTELVQGVRQDVTQIEADKRVLEAQAREQRRLAEEYEAQKRQYAADLERRQEMLHDVQASRAEAQQELDDLESESEEMTTRIRAFTEMLNRRREAQREAAMLRRRIHPPLEGQNGDDGGEPDEAPIWHGGFIKPCEGAVTSGFGYRYHPILHRRKMHTGVDFGAGYGSAIRAAAGGTVVFAAYTRGYGNCVIIDHGNNITTLYGHCSELLVGENTVVQQGQTIARVGATGMATGPHLHFEVRHDGIPVRPF